MPTPREAIEADIIHDLLFRLRQAWLNGYNAAFERWKADADLRELAAAKLEEYLAVFHRGVPASVSREALAVQLVNVASMKQADPLEWLQRLPTIAPPAPAGWWQRLFGGASPPALPEDEAWKRVITGMQSPDWDHAAAAWSAFSPRFRSILERVFSNDPPPAALVHAPEIAWLDRVANGPRLPEDEHLEALRALEPSEAEALADMLIEQHRLWREREVVKDSGHHSLDGISPERLANHACFNAPLPPAVRGAARIAGIHYPPLIFRGADPPSPDEPWGPASTSHEVCAAMEALQRQCLDEGVTLVETDAVPESPAVLAPATRYVRPAGSSDEPMLVLFDIDLTQPATAFLGLRGQRLIVCGEGEPAGEGFSTRISLDGKAALYPHEPQELVPADGPKLMFAEKPMINGRPLLSPFEGLREAGYLGTRERLGGLPELEQEAHLPRSPETGEPMTFIGQRSHPDGGTVYVFLDRTHLICTVMHQFD